MTERRPRESSGPAGDTAGDEPSHYSWTVRSIDDVLSDLIGGPRLRPDSDAEPAPLRTGPRFVAIDGRGGAGKTTLATRLQARTPGTAIVHTDDLAWNHSIFDWADVMIRHVISPLASGEPVSYRPPGWVRERRPGAVEVPSDARLVLIEGTGAVRHELSPYLDGSLWVRTPPSEAVRRLVARDGAEKTERDLATWAPEEDRFFRRHLPWLRADVIVDGAPTLPHDPEVETVVAAQPARRAGVGL